MPDVATAPTATAAQTRAAGSRMIGYYLGVGGVKVDVLFDTANFLTKNAGGSFEGVVPGGGTLFVEQAGSSSVKLRSSATMQYDVAAASSHQFLVNGATVAQIGPGSGGEIGRFITPTPRGSGLGFLSIHDPTGRKAYFGYGGGNDTLYISNDLNGFLAFAVNGANRWFMHPTAGSFYPATDNGYSIGQSSNRISVVYAATGTINTSDADEKDWLATGLSPEEMQAARRIAADIGTYRWLSSVAEKGEDARIHVGVRAQAVWAIMADEGLIDPIVQGEPPSSRYAFLCYDAWDAVEAVAEERDEEGNITVEAVEARPAGNRFGIRPDQLTLFLIAAQEARIAALEAA